MVRLTVCQVRGVGTVERPSCNQCLQNNFRNARLEEDKGAVGCSVSQTRAISPSGLSYLPAVLSHLILMVAVSHFFLVWGRGLEAWVRNHGNY